MGRGTAAMLGHTAGRRMLKPLLNLMPRRRHRGVSLVESMVVLAVSAVVLATGAPAIGRWVRDLEVRNSASALLSALQAARAEAVTRNTDVRIALGDAQGRIGWRLSCVRAMPGCPNPIRSQPVDGISRVRWAASLAPMPAFDQALPAGARLPGNISFDTVGAAPAVAAGLDLARIDVIHADDADARRLVVLVTAQGMVRLCDPAPAAAIPERCN